MANSEECVSPTLIAYKLVDDPLMRLVAASPSRSWMDATSKKYANRCLPLRIANQSGWFILNSHEIRAIWNGRADNMLRISDHGLR
jgi:hypothetical protein